jgi:hypothetical protein
LEWWIRWLFLEQAIVEYGQYIFLEGNNISIVEMDLVIVLVIVDEFYSSIDLHVVLITIEIWHEINPFTESTTLMVKIFLNRIKDQHQHWCTS